ncbi:MAG: LamG-like jellyroll fold domain-containing protein [Haloarculaceae archaeon]
MNSPFDTTADERALNTALAHALTLSITVILIVGLVTATTGFFETEREQVAQEELRTIGNRIASDVVQATSLADRGGVTNVTTEHPERVAGDTYAATILTGSECEAAVDTCLRLETTELEVSVVIPVANETGFQLAERNAGTFTVTTMGSSPTTSVAPSRVGDVGVSSQVGVGAGIARISSVSLTQPGNQPPAANFQFAPASPHAGTDVRFDASGSRDPDGDIKEYRWDFDGDGNFDENTTSSTLNRSLPAGRQNVTLEVWDGSARGNTSQQIDVSGLAYLGDLDTISGPDSATFTVQNNFAKEIHLMQLLVDPADDSISELDEETTRHEVEVAVDGSDEHWVEYDDGLSLRAGGEFIDFKYDGTTRADDEYIEVDAGETATIDLRYFSSSVQGSETTLGLKYRYGSSSDVTNTTVFTDVVGGPGISDYRVESGGPDGQDVDVTFESNQELTDIEAQMSGDASGTLDEFDFTETQVGPGVYTYTADVSDGSNGTFTVELTSAESDGTASADTPIADTAFVGTTTGVLWQTASDWDASTVSEGSVVHADFGDHSADRVQLGYNKTGLGLVGYWPLDDPSTGTAPDESVTTSNDGSIRGSPAQPNGLGGSTAYRLDGDDDYIEIPDSSSLEVGDDDEVTVSAWVNKQDTQQSSTWVALFQHSDQSYNLQFNNGNEPRLSIYEDGEWTAAQADNGIGNNQWVHLVGTFEDGRVELFVDGQQEEYECQDEAGNSGNCKDGEGIDTTSEPAGIGENIDKRTNDGEERLLDGKVDEVRVYNRALDDDEVERLFETFEQSTFTTDIKTADSTLDVANLQFQYDIEDNSQVAVESRVLTDEGEVSDWESLPSSSSKVDVSGLSTDTDTFQIQVRLSTSSVTESPVVDEIGVVEG